MSAAVAVVSAARLGLPRKQGGKVIEIELLDHVIVGDTKADPQSRGFYSFKEASLLWAVRPSVLGVILKR